MELSWCTVWNEGVGGDLTKEQGNRIGIAGYSMEFPVGGGEFAKATGAIIKTQMEDL